MAVLRQANLLSQQRIDVPHLRAVESGVAADFDVLAGRSWAGQQAMVLRGFAVSNAASLAPATSLQLSTADGIVFNVQATESGTFLWVPADRPVETLNPVANSRISGGWTPGGSADVVNYVGIDFTRNSDSTTTDLVQFQDSNTLLETPKQVPLARTLDYRIVIGTVPFSGQPNLVPIAKVTLNASGQITAIEDARPMAFRLGTGGDSPDRGNFFGGWTRRENYGSVDSSVFTGGDKSISSLKQWQDAVMTRLWESSGGEFWYSATADRNVQLVTFGSPLANGEYFDWDLGTKTLTFQNLRMLFDNSTAYSANIANGAVIMEPGDALYVDLDRSRFYAAAWVTVTAYVIGDLVVNGGNAYEATTNGTSAAGPSGTGSAIVDGTVTWKYVGPGTAGSMTVAKAPLALLGTGTPPGSRWILAWRRGAEIFTRGWRYPVGTTFQVATTTSVGMVKLSRDASTPLAPIVISDGGGTIVAPAGNNVGLDVTGSGNKEGIVGRSGTTFSFQSIGVHGLGMVAGSYGVFGNGYSNAAGNGYTGVGGLGGSATAGTGSGGIGGEFTGGDGFAGSVGVGGIGVEARGGVAGLNGDGGHGVIGRSGSSFGYGVVGTGNGGTFVNATLGDGSGVYGVAGGTSGSGVVGTGRNNVSSYGVKGVGANGTTLGRSGVLGTGGSGSTAGGFGVVGTGGDGGAGLGAPGVYGVGGTGVTSNGEGVRGEGGGTNGVGVKGLGVGVGTGVQGFSSGATGTPFNDVGGAFFGTNVGLYASGVGTGKTGAYIVGSASGNSRGIEALSVGTAEALLAQNFAGVTSQTAIRSEGYVTVASSDPAAGTGFTDTVTAKNVTKMWADITVPTAAGNCTLNDGFNVGTPGVNSSGVVSIPIVDDMATGNYCVSITNQDNGGTGDWFWYVITKTANSVSVGVNSWNGSAIAAQPIGGQPSAVAGRFMIQITGAQ